MFEAFVNPAITSRFWFTKGSGRLEAGKQIRWDWEMYNFSIDVKVKAVERNARILIEWPSLYWLGRGDVKPRRRFVRTCETQSFREHAPVILL